MHAWSNHLMGLTMFHLKYSVFSNNIAVLNMCSVDPKNLCAGMSLLHEEEDDYSHEV